jgi:hypothetical protein
MENKKPPDLSIVKRLRRHLILLSVIFGKN